MDYGTLEWRLSCSLGNVALKYNKLKQSKQRKEAFETYNRHNTNNSTKFCEPYVFHSLSALPNTFIIHILRNPGLILIITNNFSKDSNLQPLLIEQPRLHSLHLSLNIKN